MTGVPDSCLKEQLFMSNLGGSSKKSEPNGGIPSGDSVGIRG